MRTLHSALVLAAAVLLAVPALARAEDKKVNFDDKAALEGWKITGDATIDAAKPREGAGGSLKLAPGSKALLKVSDTDSAGTVEFWAYEDKGAPADPKVNGVGAVFGVVGADGKGALIGSIYAKYLSGDAIYTQGNTDINDKKDSPSRKVQYLGQPAKRTEGWHKWTLTMDADKGLSIMLDGKDVNPKGKKAVFDWNKTELKGISTIVLRGDATKDAKQTLWIDDLTVTLTGPMKAKPEAPAAPAPAPAPATKPLPTGPLPPQPAE